MKKIKSKENTIKSSKKSDILKSSYRKYKHKPHSTSRRHLLAAMNNLLRKKMPSSFQM